MIISLINLSHGQISDADIQTALRAVNRQVSEDFAPHWGFGGALRLEGNSNPRIRQITPQDVRGDAVLYIYDGENPEEIEGFHDSTNKGIPYGVVYLQVAGKLCDSWSTTLSHEALELIADPEANLLVKGPHPTHKRGHVYYWYEVCDPVQTESYKIDGIDVSNFVLPLYFTSSEERCGRNDFLGMRHQRKTLRSFGTNPGGYVGYFDPQKRRDDTLYDPRGGVALRRFKIKKRFGAGRGVQRRLKSR